MNATIELPEIDTSTPLDHGLRPYLPELAQYSSTKTLEASALYKELRPEIDRVMSGLVQGQCARRHPRLKPDGLRPIKVTAWNIERGKRLDGIIRVLQEHPPFIESDLLLLTELDYGMARTSNRFVAREIAEALEMNYAFVPCYLSLVKGNGSELNVVGENTQALHGNALFSRYPLINAHSFALPNGIDKFRGKEKRLGCQRAVVADVDHPLGMFRAVSLHLDAHSTQKHRRRQMELVLDHVERLRPALPVLIGGDWNTSGYNSKRAVYTIAGFWRRVSMGVGHVLRNHYVHPENWFERGLFRELDRRGFNYRDLNEMGTGTLHYDVKNIEVHESLADWVPTWCFRFLHWSLRKYDGRASLKLDWFAGKKIAVDNAEPPKVVANLVDEEGPLSDHDAIVLSFIPLETATTSLSSSPV
jgi:endonuclease/exonuclease/phosphatase family metal-dependent hydrolase